VVVVETANCVNCGAPDQSLVAECQYCGHQPPVPTSETPVQEVSRDNVIPFQGEMSQFKLILSSVVFGVLVSVVARMLMGG